MLEEELSTFETRIILLERSIINLVIKLDTFMCMENAGNDSIDNGTDIADKVTIGLFDGNVAVENEKDDSSRSSFAMDNIDNEIKEDNVVQ